MVIARLSLGLSFLGLRNFLKLCHDEKPCTWWLGEKGLGSLQSRLARMLHHEYDALKGYRFLGGAISFYSVSCMSDVIFNPSLLNWSSLILTVAHIKAAGQAFKYPASSRVLCSLWHSTWVTIHVYHPQNKKKQLAKQTAHLRGKNSSNRLSQKTNQLLQAKKKTYCWWFRNPSSPVEVGSFSHYLQGFLHFEVVVWDFFHQ